MTVAVKPQQACECGCGELASPGRRFRHGHAGRTQRGIKLGPMSAEHRAKIAASQRKRLAARRGIAVGPEAMNKRAHERRVERIKEAHRLDAEGHDSDAISLALNVSVGTVRGYLGTDLAALLETDRGPAIVSRCAHCDWSVELPVQDAAAAFKAHECDLALSA